jgi:hypothetical protein
MVRNPSFSRATPRSGMCDPSDIPGFRKRN